MSVFIVSYACSRRLQSLTMTSADLCAMYKPWRVQENVVSTIMDEFWEEVCFFFFKKKNILFVIAAFFERTRETEEMHACFCFLVSIFIFLTFDLLKNIFLMILG